jgi:hypothetical protein
VVPDPLTVRGVDPGSSTSAVTPSGSVTSQLRSSPVSSQATLTSPCGVRSDALAQVSPPPGCGATRTFR